MFVDRNLSLTHTNRTLIHKDAYRLIAKSTRNIRLALCSIMGNQSKSNLSEIDNTWNLIIIVSNIFFPFNISFFETELGYILTEETKYTFASRGGVKVNEARSKNEYNLKLMGYLINITKQNNNMN